MASTQDEPDSILTQYEPEIVVKCEEGTVPIRSSLSLIKNEEYDIGSNSSISFQKEEVVNQVPGSSFAIKKKGRPKTAAERQRECRQRKNAESFMLSKLSAEKQLEYRLRKRAFLASMQNEADSILTQNEPEIVVQCEPGTVPIRPALFQKYEQMDLGENFTSSQQKLKEKILGIKKPKCSKRRAAQSKQNSARNETKGRQRGKARSSIASTKSAESQLEYRLKKRAILASRQSGPDSISTRNEHEINMKCKQGTAPIRSTLTLQYGQMVVRETQQKLKVKIIGVKLSKMPAIKRTEYRQEKKAQSLIASSPNLSSSNFTQNEPEILVNREEETVPIQYNLSLIKNEECNSESNTSISFQNDEAVDPVPEPSFVFNSKGTPKTYPPWKSEYRQRKKAHSSAQNEPDLRLTQNEPEIVVKCEEGTVPIQPTLSLITNEECNTSISFQNDEVVDPLPGSSFKFNTKGRPKAKAERQREYRMRKKAQSIMAVTQRVPHSRLTQFEPEMVVKCKDGTVQIRRTFSLIKNKEYNPGDNTSVSFQNVEAVGPVPGPSFASNTKGRPKTDAERQREYRMRKKTKSIMASTKSEPDSGLNQFEPEIVVKCEEGTVPIRSTLSVVENEEYDIESNSSVSFQNDEADDSVPGSSFACNTKGRPKTDDERQRELLTRKTAQSIMASAQNEPDSILTKNEPEIVVKCEEGTVPTRSTLSVIKNEEYDIDSNTSLSFQYDEADPSFGSSFQFNRKARSKTDAEASTKREPDSRLTRNEPDSRLTQNEPEMVVKYEEGTVPIQPTLSLIKNEECNTSISFQTDEAMDPLPGSSFASNTKGRTKTDAERQCEYRMRKKAKSIMASTKREPDLRLTQNEPEMVVKYEEGTVPIQPTLSLIKNEECNISISFQNDEVVDPLPGSSFIFNTKGRPKAKAKRQREYRMRKKAQSIMASTKSEPDSGLNQFEPEIVVKCEEGTVPIRSTLSVVENEEYDPGSNISVSFQNVEAVGPVPGSSFASNTKGRPKTDAERQREYRMRKKAKSIMASTKSEPDSGLNQFEPEIVVKCEEGTVPIRSTLSVVENEEYDPGGNTSVSFQNVEAVGPVPGSSFASNTKGRPKTDAERQREYRMRKKAQSIMASTKSEPDSGLNQFEPEIVVKCEEGTVPIRSTLSVVENEEYDPGGNTSVSFQNVEAVGPVPGSSFASNSKGRPKTDAERQREYRMRKKAQSIMASTKSEPDSGLNQFEPEIVVKCEEGTVPIRSTLSVVENEEYDTGSNISVSFQNVEAVGPVPGSSFASNTKGRPKTDAERQREYRMRKKAKSIMASTKREPDLRLTQNEPEMVVKYEEGTVPIQPTLSLIKNEECNTLISFQNDEVVDPLPGSSFIFNTKGRPKAKAKRQREYRMRKKAQSIMAVTQRVPHSRLTQFEPEMVVKCNEKAEKAKSIMASTKSEPDSGLNQFEPEIVVKCEEGTVPIRSTLSVVENEEYDPGSNISVSFQNVEAVGPVPGSSFASSTKGRPKTDAERQREYRMRKKAKSIMDSTKSEPDSGLNQFEPEIVVKCEEGTVPIRSTLSVVENEEYDPGGNTSVSFQNVEAVGPVPGSSFASNTKGRPKTDAERQREYRMRKKAQSIMASTKSEPDSGLTQFEPEIVVKCEEGTVPIRSTLSVVENEEYDTGSNISISFQNDEVVDPVPESSFTFNRKRRPKTDAERQREYRMRKKASRLPKAPPKTPRERSRLYRERKKIVNAFIEYQLQIQPQLVIGDSAMPGTSSGAEGGTNYIEPNQENTITDQSLHTESLHLEKALATLDPKIIAHQATQMTATPEFIAILQRKKGSGERKITPRSPAMTVTERSRLNRERKKLTVMEAYRKYHEMYSDMAGITTETTASPQDLEEPLVFQQGSCRLGLPLHHQARKIVYNVTNYLREQKKKFKLKFNMNKSVHDATGVGIYTIRAVLKEGDASLATYPNIKFTTMDEEKEDSDDEESFGSCRSGLPLHPQARKIVYNVTNYLREQKKKFKLKFNVNKSVHDATGVGMSTIKAVLKEGDALLEIEPNIKFTTMEEEDEDSDDEELFKASDDGGTSRSTEPVPAIPFVEVKSEALEDEDDISDDGTSDLPYSPKPSAPKVVTVGESRGPLSPPLAKRMLLTEGIAEEFESAGANVSRKLARMTPVQAIYAESLISAVLRRGLLERLQEHSDICDNRCGRRAVLASQSQQVSTSLPVSAVKEEPPEEIN